MNLAGRTIALVYLLSITTAHADASSEDVGKAIETWDTRALQAMADQTSDLPAQALARAVLQMFDGKDAAAISSLEELTDSGQLDDGVRFIAFTALGRLHLRNQHYVPAAKALESALEAAGSAPPDAADAVKDDLRYARANADIPAMTVAVKSPEFSSPIIRDAMDLSRVTATINGHRMDAVLDTGASNCVVSVSTAKRLHLRRVRFEGGVSADGQPVAAQFAVAGTVLFAGREFRNVPFFVLADESVRFPLEHGAVGKFEPVIGLSVLRKLGRFEIVQRAGKERLRVGAISTTAGPASTPGTPAATGTPAKLLLPEGAPAVLVRIEPEGSEVRLLLDTGSNRTALAPTTLAALPALASRAARGRVGAADVAGSWSNDAGTLIPQLTLRVGEAAIPLSRVPVGPGAEHLDGTLGQDVFRSGGGYVIDFDRMTLEILPAVVATN